MVRGRIWGTPQTASRNATARAYSRSSLHAGNSRVSL